MHFPFFFDLHIDILWGGRRGWGWGGQGSQALDFREFRRLLSRLFPGWPQPFSGYAGYDMIYIYMYCISPYSLKKFSRTLPFNIWLYTAHVCNVSVHKKTNRTCIPYQIIQVYTSQTTTICRIAPLDSYACVLVGCSQMHNYNDIVYRHDILWSTHSALNAVTESS